MLFVYPRGFVSEQKGKVVYSTMSASYKEKMVTKIEIITEGLYNIRILFNNILYRTRGGNYLEKQKKMNKSIHVIANGPSYSHTESSINDIPGDCMCMNFALDKELVKRHNPKLICWCDPDFFTEEYNKRRNSVLEYCEHNGALFYVPFVYIKGTNLVNHPNVRTINSIAKKGEIYTKSTKKRYEKNTEVPAFQTVAIMSIYVAIQLGYSTIYLHGVDEDQLKSLEMIRGELYTQYYHFYEESKREKLNYTMFQMTKAHLTLLEGFKKIAQYAKDENVDIFNMNEKSNVEFFEYYDWK